MFSGFTALAAGKCFLMSDLQPFCCSFHTCWWLHTSHPINGLKAITKRADLGGREWRTPCIWVEKRLHLAALLTSHSIPASLTPRQVKEAPAQRSEVDTSGEVG